MEKSPHQIARYLLHCRFSDNDWRLVLDFCSKNRLPKPSKSPKPRSKSTFNQFIQWIENGLGSGDVAKYEGSTVLVSTFTPDYARIAALMLRSGKIELCEKQVAPELLQKVKDTEARSFQYTMRQSGLGFDVRSGIAYKLKEVGVGHFVSYEAGGTEGVGVVMSVTQDKLTLFFAIENNTLLHNVEYLRTNVVYSLAGGDLRASALVFLKDKGFLWDARRKSLVSVLPKSDNGGYYYYITDHFGIGRAVENGKTDAKLRYNNGNYFLTREEAEKFCIRVRALRGK